MPEFFAYIAKYRRQILIGTTLISFFYFLWEVNSWQYAYVGDVWKFYTFARDLVHHHFQSNPFSSIGVYENPALGSFYQAVFLNVFGLSNFAWRLSNIILIIPTSYFFYKWLKLSFDWKIAMLSTVLMQMSYYLSTFFKIGYVNPQSLFLFVLALYLAALSGLQPTKRHGLFLGLVLGISFYIYIGPIFPLLIWPYLLPLVKSKGKLPKGTVMHYMVMLALGYCFFLSFTLTTHYSLAGPLSKSGLHNQPDSQQVFTNIGNNLLVYYHEFPILPTHFIPFAYLDRVSQVFALLGTLVCIGFIYKKQYRYLVLTYLSTCVLLGVTNPYTIPPTSRGMFLLIFGFIFAAIGIRLITRLSFVKEWAVLPILLLIGALNVYISQYATFAKIDYTSMAILVGDLQLAHQESHKSVVLVLSDTLPIKKYMFEVPTLLEAYGLKDIQFETMSPQDVSCDSLKNKKIVAYSYDSDAVETLQHSNCQGTFQTLATSITYY